MKRYRFLFLFMISAALLASELSAPAVRAQDSQTNEALKIFGEAFEKIRKEYVDDPPEDRKLIEAAIQGMLGALEHPGTYYSTEDFKAQSDNIKGKFAGLGIEVRMDEGFVKVVTPIEGSPADKAGILPEDLITRIDGKSVRGLALKDAVRKMRGPVGSSVSVTVKRPGMDKPFDVNIVRATIKLVDVRHRVEGRVGYVRIASFNELTPQHVKKAVEAAIGQIGTKDLKGLVLDLRNCPGGDLRAVIKVADHFLDSGRIYTSRGRVAKHTEMRNAEQGDMSGGADLVVLINKGTSSGAEIFAGALQDHKRARLVGTRTFGHGRTATWTPIQAFGGGYRLTTGRFITPSGRQIDGTGLSPDVSVEPSKKGEPDRQLERALQLLRE